MPAAHTIGSVGLTRGQRFGLRRNGWAHHIVAADIALCGLYCSTWDYDCPQEDWQPLCTACFMYASEKAGMVRNR